ncbi:glycosyltransferase family 69 protein [Thermothelomyces thermophilus ATCC 42464]|uniref:Glycosyltransferase family 69 protein n=1 Tax=Thermothelomyces thermophilus (strain ATCC 42464 / BCRC 31852 / DSM 1799) TaxID=573729 RepID=G2QLS4_THET4|nr:glycosyltransferase family 69 protein [Thermothelomyces thermophilus ATCC 42464]AEO60904.1 glycosyltransferase family 69 protein [Thermothelomyces thermophilus ATCC 42464]
MAARRTRLLPKIRSALQKLLFVYLVWTIIEAHRCYYRISRAEREAIARTDLIEPTRVYIASLHWNNEDILRSEWNKAVLDLVKTFGANNVFVSVYESGSWDDTKGALRELDKELETMGVARKIILDQETHKDLITQPPADEGWITIPDGTRMPRRIPYLSKLRNLSLRPLLELAENGTTFDQVLFLGDVVFTVSDVLNLLKTNNGRYAAACSLDFSKPPNFYDTFALRDARGHQYATQTWPYFRASQSRKAMINAKPVPVSSCWNGIVAMPASTFAGIRGLRFRGIPDDLATSHLEASECCLIHADNPASRSRGVFVNPAVRVGYDRKAYDAVHRNAPRRRDDDDDDDENGHSDTGGGGGGSWLSLSEVYFGLWKNRLARWLTTPWFEEQEVRRRIERWARAGEGREEKGEFCVVDEMQIVVHNGWKHLR